MKFFAKLILVIFLIPTILIALISSTIEFQLLKPDFWNDILAKNNVYATLSNDSKIYAENQILKGGGKTSDLKILTDVVTPSLIQDFIVHNLDNFLGFANGVKKDLIVYIPINKIPKELQPKSVGLDSEEIPFTALLSKFNIDIGNFPISQVAYFGMSVNYFLIGSISLTILFLVLLFVLTESGDRFISIGLSFTLTGFIILSLVKMFDSIASNINKSPTVNLRIDEIILGTVTPLILQEITKTWLWIGIILLILGIVLFFLKKPPLKTTNKI